MSCMLMKLHIVVFNFSCITPWVSFMHHNSALFSPNLCWRFAVNTFIWRCRFITPVQSSAPYSSQFRTWYLLWEIQIILSQVNHMCLDVLTVNICTCDMGRWKQGAKPADVSAWNKKSCWKDITCSILFNSINIMCVLLKWWSLKYQMHLWAYKQSTLAWLVSIESAAFWFQRLSDSISGNNNCFCD